jgi:anti-sigma regulatory factor (Ser/Thr protein kinase)
MATFQVREPLDVFEPRRAIQAIAERLGFARSDCRELAIVVSELASNIIKYGVSGSISIEGACDPDHGLGVSVVAEDVGPPFYNLSLAIQDGYDDRGPIDPASLLKRRGLGAGLGAVIRLTDKFHVIPLAKGKQVCAVRYLRRTSRTRSGR